MAAILIVDDSPDNTRLFRTLLTLQGHQIISLPGGDELFSTLAQCRPDLILMDLQMPGKDGFMLLAVTPSSRTR